MNFLQSIPDTNEDEAVPQAVTDEELFASYIAARMQQGLDSLNEARDRLAGQRHDFNLVLQVMRKVRELQELRKELADQNARVRAAREAAGMSAEEAENDATPQTTPGPEFRAAQAEQAAKIMATLADKPRTCPECQALLSADTVQCTCGYDMSKTSGTADRSTHAAPISSHATTR